jgi:hypothetical protein
LLEAEIAGMPAEHRTDTPACCEHGVLAMHTHRGPRIALANMVATLFEAGVRA